MSNNRNSKDGKDVATYLRSNFISVPISLIVKIHVPCGKKMIGGIVCRILNGNFSGHSIYAKDNAEFAQVTIGERVITQLISALW